MKEIITRSITGALYVLALVAGMMVSPLVFTLVFTIALSFNVQEFYGIVEKTKTKPQRIVGGVITAYAFLASVAYHQYDDTLLYFLALIPMAFFVFIIEMYRKSKRPVLNISSTLGGVIYIGLPFVLMTHLVFYTGAFNGKLLLGIFSLMWIADTMAYLFGITLGKHRLFERISPKKSWEGFIGGTLSTILIGYFLMSKLGVIAPVHWAVIAAIAASFGTFGDLVESMFKRSVHIKDSGKALPGHGGFLDRFDSILFVIPVVFFYLELV